MFRASVFKDKKKIIFNQKYEHTQQTIKKKAVILYNNNKNII